MPLTSFHLAFRGSWPCCGHCHEAMCRGCCCCDLGCCARRGSQLRTRNGTSCHRIRSGSASVMWWKTCCWNEGELLTWRREVNLGLNPGGTNEIVVRCWRGSERVSENLDECQFLRCLYGQYVRRQLRGMALVGQARMVERAEQLVAGWRAGGRGDGCRMRDSLI